MLGNDQNHAMSIGPLFHLNPPKTWSFSIFSTIGIILPFHLEALALILFYFESRDCPIQMLQVLELAVCSYM